MKRAASAKVARTSQQPSMSKTKAPRATIAKPSSPSGLRLQPLREAQGKRSMKPAPVRKLKKESAEKEPKPTAKEDEDEDEEESTYRMKLRIGTVALPEGLVRAVAHVTRGQNREALAAAGSALSEALRARTRSSLPSNSLGSIFSTQDIPTLAYNEVEATAYAAHRLPGVFACISRVLSEVRARVPEWTPRRMLDFGSGPGTAVWAAHVAWPEDLRTFTLVDRSPHMARLAKTLTTELSVKHGAQLSWRRNLQHVPAHDLVSCSYVLSELQSDKERARELTQMWERLEPGGVIIIVEPGTPLGFEYIRRARAQLLGQPDASVLAPCPHGNACPMSGNSWCHFAQRVQRTTWQMAAKRDASVNWEDEKFSYVALRRTPGGPADFARIVRAPMKRGGHVVMTACTPTGHLETRTITKAQGRQRYRQAVKTKWGDGFRTQLP